MRPREKEKEKRSKLNGTEVRRGLGLCEQSLHVRLTEPMSYSVISRLREFRPEGDVEQREVGDVAAVL